MSTDSTSVAHTVIQGQGPGRPAAGAPTQAEDAGRLLNLLETMRVVFRFEVFTDKSEAPGFLGECVPCRNARRPFAVSGDRMPKDVFVWGPWQNRVVLKIGCGKHSGQECVRAAGQDPDLLLLPGHPGGLPDVMPELPWVLKHAFWKYETPPGEHMSWDTRLFNARIASFLYQLPRAWPGPRQELIRLAADALMAAVGERLMRSERAARKNRAYSGPELYVNQVRQQLSNSPRKVDDGWLGLVAGVLDRVLSQVKTLVSVEEMGLSLAPPQERTTQEQEWWVEGLLAAGEPFMCGGPLKAFKSSLLIDLAVSLAAGVPFLGAYRVPRRLRVAYFCAEGGVRMFDETVTRVCKAKGLPGIPENLRRCTGLPRFASESDLAAVQYVLREFGAQVAIFDPVYLSMFDGAAGKNPANLFDSGPLLRRITEACRAVGCVAGLAHHATKDVRPGPHLTLNDLAFAGFGEFSSQWLLVNHRRAYDEEAGHARLILSYGGRAGHSGLVAVDAVVGRLGAGDRKWEVTVMTPDEAAQRDQEATAERKLSRETQTEDRRKKKVVTAADELAVKPGDEVGARRLRTQASMDSGTFEAALNLLFEDKLFEDVPGSKPRAVRRLA